MKVILKRVKSIIFLVCITLTTTQIIPAALDTQESKDIAKDVELYYSVVLEQQRKERNKEYDKGRTKRLITETAATVAGVSLINLGLFLIGRGTLSILKSHPKIGALLFTLETIGFTCMAFPVGFVSAWSLLDDPNAGVGTAVVMFSILASFPASFAAGFMSQLPLFHNFAI